MTKGIYCYIDKENDKIVYVGKDSNIDKNKRHRQHLAPSLYNAQPINRILQNNPDRYTYQRLWEIDDCTNNHLNQMEIFYIKKYDSQFNFTEGGDGVADFRHSEESRKKMSEAKKGKALSEEVRKKMSENNARYWQGKTLSEETKKKISESKKGKKPYEMTEETKKKMSKSKNITGFYRVSKGKNNTCKQGFTWRYQYFDNNKRKTISSIDLKKLEKKVKKEGLEWKIINKKNSIKSIQENNNRFN